MMGLVEGSELLKGVELSEDVLITPEYRQGSCGYGSRFIFLRMEVIMLYQCLGDLRSPYKVLLSSQNSSLL